MGTRLHSVRTKNIRATLQRQPDNTLKVVMTVIPCQGGGLAQPELWQHLLTSISAFASVAVGEVWLSCQPTLPMVKPVELKMTLFDSSKMSVTAQKARKGQRKSK